MKDTETAKLLIDYSRRAYDRGLVGGTGGNISVRLEDEKHMLITSSGLSLKDTSSANLVRVNLESLQHEAPSGLVPSMEFHIHADIYRLRQDAGAVVHLHPPYCTAFAVKKRSIPAVTDSALKQPPIPRVPFAPSGTDELRRYTAEALKTSPGCQVLLLEMHGIVAIGSNIIKAYDTADLTEESARIAYLAQALH
ncbi:MAG: class II aldolase/adducin family protein [Desulfatiglandaceae bacterium]